MPPGVPFHILVLLQSFPTSLLLNKEKTLIRLEKKAPFHWNKKVNTTQDHPFDKETSLRCNFTIQVMFTNYAAVLGVMLLPLLALHPFSYDWPILNFTSVQTQQSKYHVEWYHPPSYMFRLATDILARHCTSTGTGDPLNCTVTYPYKMDVIVVQCPENETFVPPSREQALEIFKTMDKEVESLMKIARYEKAMNRETWNLLMMLWNKGLEKPMTQREIIDEVIKYS